MASIDKRPDGLYQARWRVGPQKTRHFDRKGDADRFLGAIRRSEIQEWVKKLSEQLAPGSLELVYRWVATIFKAVGDRLIAASPRIRIALPKKLDTR